MELTCFILLPFAVAMAWIVAFLINKRYLRMYDRVQIVLLGCCALTCYIVMRSLYVGTGDYLYIVFDNIETLLGLFICPLLFIYMRMVARDSHWHNWYYLLFIPGVLIGLSGTALSIAVGWDRILEIRGDSYAAFMPNPDSAVENLYRLVNITLFNITLEIMAVVLIGWSIFYLMRYYRRIGNYYADLELSSAGWMHRFLISAIALMLTIFMITVFITEIIGQGSAILVVVSAWLSVLSWSLGYNTYYILLTDRHIDVIDEVEDTTDKTSVIEPDDAIAQKIQKWQSDHQKPFCREGIVLHDVAHEMDVNPRELSVYINRHYGMNFNRWINTLRIEEAKRLLSKSDDVKISYVSTMCGFSDPGSLTRTFRMIEGCSPKEYRIKDQ